MDTKLTFTSQGMFRKVHKINYIIDGIYKGVDQTVLIDKDFNRMTTNVHHVHARVVPGAHTRRHFLFHAQTTPSKITLSLPSFTTSMTALN